MDLMDEKKDVVIYENNMDVADEAARDVRVGRWVKVPKYMSSRLEKCSGDIKIGQLNITKYILFRLFSLLKCDQYVCMSICCQ